jgi:hypothetical protein
MFSFGVAPLKLGDLLKGKEHASAIEGRGAIAGGFDYH